MKTRLIAEMSNRRGEILFWSVALCAMFLFLGLQPLWASEDRWAEIAREMRLTGDYIHPAVNHLVYLDKPQLTYWLIVLVSLPFAALDELLVRLPSVLLALAALAGTLSLGRSLYDEGTARMGAWLLLSSYAFIFWARLAQADIANLAAIVLAVAWFLKNEERGGFRAYFVFYLICFGGALAKGLPALVMPFVVIAPFLWRDGRWKRHLKVSNFLAILPALALYAAPLYLAQTLAYAEGYIAPDHELGGWGLVWRENIVRVFRPFDHDDEPFFCYLYQLPRCLAPWSLLVIGGLAGLVVKWRRLDTPTRDLMIGAGLMFILFSASGSRRWYYIMPLMPFVLLLTARAFCMEGRAWWNDVILKIMRYAIIAVAAVATVSPLCLPAWKWIFHFTPPLLFSIALPVLGILALLVMFSEEIGRNAFSARLTGMPGAVAAIVVGGSLLSCGFFAALYPAWGALRTEKPLLLKVREEMPRAARGNLVLWYREPLPKINFYLDLAAPMPIIRKTEELQKQMEHFGTRPWAIITYENSRYAEALRQSAAEAGLKIDFERPDWIEEPQLMGKKNDRRLAVWLINN